MIRSGLCLAVIIISAALASPGLLSSNTATSSYGPRAGTLTVPDPGNVTASLTAFNYSLASANLFTNATAKLSQPLNSTELKWFSTVNNTATGSQILGTAFNYTVGQTHAPSRYTQTVSWNITVPKSNCGAACTTYISFTLYGTLTKGASENFTLVKGTTPIESGIFQGNDTNFRSICTLAKGSNATVCGPTVKLPVSSQVGSLMTLSFSFGWNSTSPGTKLNASVGELVVESLQNTINNSASSVMNQSGNTIIHYATLSSIGYNTTNPDLTGPRWSIEVLNLYYMSGYTVTTLQINGTNAPNIALFPLPSSFSKSAFERMSCNDGATCSQTLLALNMSDFKQPVLHLSTVLITAVSTNSVSQVSTLSGGVATTFFTAGDTLSVDVVNSPSIENASTTLQTGSLVIRFNSGLSIPSQTVPTAKGGVFDFQLPNNCGILIQLCAMNWNYSVTFTSMYDLGNRTGSFRMDLLTVKSFSSTGGSNSLSVQGSLEYGNGNPAAGLNATIVTLDANTPSNIPFTTNQTLAVSSQTPLYVANATLVNGVFTQGQALIILFTVVNNNPSQAYNATLSIEHLWPGPEHHAMNITYSLAPGDPLNDLPFKSTAQTYEARITFTGSGVQVVLINLRTGTPWPTRTMSLGTSPVVPNRAHAGLFNITVTSTINNVAQSPVSWILSPTYAYVPASLAPSRYLSASSAIKTDSNGGFSLTISNPRALLGAKNLTVFVLARDANGIVVVNNLPSSGYSDSTILLASVDTLSPVGKGQTGTGTLHLTSNSTAPSGITEVITVVLVVSGNGLTPYTVGTMSGITIRPGQTTTVSIPFTAPQNTGTYGLSYYSPESGAILVSQTLQVSILQGNLQLLIPVGIAVVAAIIVLGYYLVAYQRRGSEPSEEKTKPSPKPKTSPNTSPPAKALT